MEFRNRTDDLDAMKWWHMPVGKWAEDVQKKWRMKMQKEEIIKLLEEEFGFVYESLLWPDGSVMTHKFICKDRHDPEAAWIVSIEDHHDERPDVDDFVIYSYYHDPETKDWYGHQIDICGAIEYKVMKLIVAFVDILEAEYERNNVKGNLGVD